MCNRFLIGLSVDGSEWTLDAFRVDKSGKLTFAPSCAASAFSRSAELHSLCISPSEFVELAIAVHISSASSKVTER